MEKTAINTLTPPPANRPRGEVVAQQALPTTSKPAVASQVQASASQVQASAAKPPLETAPSQTLDQFTVQETLNTDRAVSATEKTELAATAQKLNAAVAIAQRSIQFDVHEETGRTIITVSDKDTGEEIRTIPPETLLRVAEHIEEMLTDKVDALRGLLINHEV